MASTSAAESLMRIVEFVRADGQAKMIVPSLRKPASNAAIKAFESKAKLKLPPVLTAIYRLHDGQDDQVPGGGEDAPPIVGLFPSIESGDLPFMLIPLKYLKQNTPTSKRASRMPGYRLKWIGFGDNQMGDNLVLDFADTTPRSKQGRILQFNHEYGCAVEVAPTLDAYLARLAKDLTAKRVKWKKGVGLSYVKGKDWDDLVDSGKV